MKAILQEKFGDASVLQIGETENLLQKKIRLLLKYQQPQSTVRTSSNEREITTNHREIPQS